MSNECFYESKSNQCIHRHGQAWASDQGEMRQMGGFWHRHHPGQLRWAACAPNSAKPLPEEKYTQFQLLDHHILLDPPKPNQPNPKKQCTLSYMCAHIPIVTYLAHFIFARLCGTIYSHQLDMLAADDE